MNEVETQILDTIKSELAVQNSKIVYEIFKYEIDKELVEMNKDHSRVKSIIVFNHNFCQRSTKINNLTPQQKSELFDNIVIFDNDDIMTTLRKQLFTEKYLPLIAKGHITFNYDLV